MMRKLKLAMAGIFVLGLVSFAVAAEPAKPPEPAKAAAPAPKKKATKKKSMKSKPAEMKKSETAQPAAGQNMAMYKCNHCNVTSDKPGKCPKCGMDMQKM